MKLALKLLTFACLILFVLNCGNRHKNKDLLTKDINIYNKSIPKNGTITLVLNIIKKKSSKELSDQNGISFFHSIKKDEKGDLYFLDKTNVKIYKFNSKGEFIKSFLNKGFGPEELSRIYKFKIINNMVICSNRNKFCCFDLNGNFIREKKLKIQTIELLDHIDDKRYITTHNIYDNNKKIGISCVLKQDNKILKDIYKRIENNIGYSSLKLQDKIFTYVGGTSPRIEYLYNSNNDFIYCCHNFDYKIYLINLEGKIKKVIHKDYKPIKITKDEFKKMAEEFRRMGWPMHYRKAFLKNPPEKNYPVIYRVRILPYGFIGILRPISSAEEVIDVFNSKGEFIYILKGNELVNISRINFFKNSVGVIVHKEDMDIYTEYKVKNLPLIYNGI